MKRRSIDMFLDDQNKFLHSKNKKIANIISEREKQE